jgi:tRNA pseudouridine55 synthase
MTSHDVVARARRVLSVRKVGHAGTLDPMGHRPAGARRRRRDPAARSTWAATTRPTRRPSDRAASTVTDDREGEVLRTVSTAELDDAAVRLRSPSRPVRCSRCPRRSSAVEVRGPALLRPGARGRGGGARAPLGHGARARGAPDRAPTADLVDVDDHRVVHPPHLQSAPSPGTPAPRWAWAATCTALRRTASGPVTRTPRRRPSRTPGAALLAGSGRGFLPLPAAAARCSECARSPRRRPGRSATGQRIPATGARAARRRRSQRPAGRPRRGRRPTARSPSASRA